MGKTSYRFLLLFLFSSFSFRGEAQLDSLLKELNNPHVDSIQLDLLNKTAFAYRSKDIDSTYYYATKALKRAQFLGVKKWINRSFYNIGVSFHIKGTFDSASFYYMEGVKIAKEINDLSGLSRLYNNLGLIDWNKGNLQPAVDFFLKSYEMDVQLNDSSGMVSAINNIGLVHRGLGELELALSYFLKAESILLGLNDDFRLSQLYNNIGLIYTSLKKIDSSLLYYQKSISYIDNPEANCYAAHPTLGIADLFTEAGNVNLDSVFHYANRSLKLARRCGLPKIQSSALLLIGDYYDGKRDYQEAKNYYAEGLKVSKQEEINVSTRDGYYRFYRLHKKLGEWVPALEFLEKYELLKSSMVNQDKVREITELETRYEAEREKQQLIAAQENERIKLEQEIQNQKERRNFYLIFAVAFLIVICLLFIIYRRERSVSITLKRKNQLISELSGFKDELINMIVHDIKNPLNSIITLAGRLGKKEGNDISKAGGSILRLVTNMLDVEKFENTTPKLSLQNVPISELVSEASLAVDLLLHDKSINLKTKMIDDVTVEVDREMIIRVFVNLLSNAIKFSPSNAEIEITTAVVERDNHSYIQVAVKDYGLGIPKEDQPYLFDKFYQSQAKKSGVTPSTGLGLTYCKMAILAHKGTIDVSSEKGLGSTFLVTLEIREVMDGHMENPGKHKLEISVSNEEKRLLKEYGARLKVLKVHNVGAIMPILDELESLDLQSDWADQLRSAVQYANGDQYQQLIALVDND